MNNGLQTDPTSAGRTDRPPAQPGPAEDISSREQARRRGKAVKSVSVGLEMKQRANDMVGDNEKAERQKKTSMADEQEEERLLLKWPPVKK